MAFLYVAIYLVYTLGAVIFSFVIKLSLTDKYLISY